MSVCLSSSVTFLFLQTLSSRNLSHGNISQFKFRIRTDYFGLVVNFYNQMDASFSDQMVSQLVVKGI